MTSASTLSRRARKLEAEGKTDSAKRLRTNAAKMRRDAREQAASKKAAAKKARRKKTPANKIVAGKTMENARKRIAKKAPKEKHKILSALEQVLERTLGEAVTTGQGAMFAGINQDTATGERRWGIRPVPAAQLLGGDNSPNAIADVERIELEKRVDDIIRMAKAKKPDALGISPRDQILSTLMMTKAIGDFEGARRNDEQARAMRKRANLNTRDAVVCGFLAEVNDAMRTTGLQPGGVWTLNNFVVARIVDALNDAGYKPDGRKSTGDTEQRRV